MAAPAPPQLYTRGPTENSMTVWWQPDTVPPAYTSVKLEVREFPKGWDDAETAQSFTLPAAAGEHVVTGLHPTATYEFRVSLISADGAVVGPSRPIAADTLAAGCVPKDGERKKSGGCVVQ